MASVSWTYPEDELIALRRRTRPPKRRCRSRRDDRHRGAATSAIASTGDKPPWRPLRAFDDGRQVFIEFPRGIGQGEMPPLFVIGPEGEGRARQLPHPPQLHVVDRLFAAAELRLGGNRQQRVRIVRTDGRQR